MKHDPVPPFSKQAALYARYRPLYPAAMYGHIFSHLDRMRVAWDCGTGTGQVAGRLAGHFEKVYACDVSREQLRHAVKRKNIEYIHGPAEKTDFPPRFFDLVTAAQAIHWFDINRFYGEVRRTARPGALLAVIGYGRARISPQTDPVLDRLYDRAFGACFGKNRSYVNDEYRTIPFPFEEIPSPRFAIRNSWTLNDLEGYFNSWSSIQKIKSEKGASPADETLEELARKLTGPFKVTFPVFLRLGKL